MKPHTRGGGGERIEPCGEHRADRAGEDVAGAGLALSHDGGVAVAGVVLETAPERAT